MSKAIETSYFDYRATLREELSRRQLQKGGYSLRSFARFLGLSPSALSEVLNGKSSLSVKSATTIAGKLKLPRQAAHVFVGQVRWHTAKSDAQKDKIGADVKKAQEVERARTLSLDRFAIIADWYHLAILELLSSAKTPLNSEAISKRFDVRPILIGEALQRLQRCGLIRMEAGGFVATHQHNEVEAGIASAAMRQYYAQLLERATHALQQPLEARDYSSNIFSIPSDKIPLAKELLRGYILDFQQKIGMSAESDAVYCWSMQLFRLDRAASSR